MSIMFWVMHYHSCHDSSFFYSYVSTYAIGNAYLQVGGIHCEAGTEPHILSSLGVK